MPLFQPHDILDSRERFLKQIGTGAAVKAVLVAAAGLLTLSPTRVLWLSGGVLFALGTWAILSSQHTREIGLEATQVPAVQSSKQSPKPETSSLSAIQQLPQAAGAAGRATREGEEAAPSTSDNGRAQPADVESPVGTSLQADKLEPINSAALGTPHAIAVEPIPSETLPAEIKGLAAEMKEPPRGRVRVASAANIHSGPSASDALLGTAQVGVEAEVAARDAEWVRIIDPASGKTGWIHSRHLMSVPADADGDESTGDQQAAFPDEQEALGLPPAQPKRSLISKKKSHKYGWKKRRHKRGLALRFVLKRLR